MKIRHSIWILGPFLLACASQAPPSGGPPDRTPPEVVETLPAEDAISIAPDQHIRIQFSEQMDRRSAEQSLFLSPVPQDGLKFNWHGQEMRAAPVGGLRTGRTYLVSVGAGSRDESGNPMKASYDFAFSTGAHIDRGEIRGRVLPLDAGRSQVYVVLYDLESRPADPDPGSNAPEYTTQAGADGTFRFPRLSTGRYRAFAFEDRDRDRLYTPGADPLSVPPADVHLEVPDAVAGLGALRPVVRDTGGAILTSIKSVDGAHVALRLNKPPSLPISALISGHPDILGVGSTHLDPADSTRILLWTDRQVEGKTYRLERLLQGDGSQIEVPRGLATFKGRGNEDLTSPRAAALSPEPGEEDVRLDQALEIIFSEPMRSTDVRELWVASDTTEAPSGTFRWRAQDRLIFAPDSPWTPGTRHRLIGGARLEDAAGNRLSSDIEMVFTTLDSARLGGISGSVTVSDLMPPGRIHLLALQLPDPRSVGRSIGGTAGGKVRAGVVLTQPGEFHLKDLPEGSYLVSAFVDLDGDGTWGDGRPSPFVPAEPFGASPDPVTVRPRWVSEGVRIDLESVLYISGEIR